jgi:16S rRNA processing protein RimM
VTARRVVAGVVRRPFGLRGQVFVHPDPDLGDEFPPGATYRTADGPLTVGESMLHRGLRVVRFAGVEDREAAAALRNRILERDAAADDLDADDGSAFWTDQVLGKPVTSPAGAALGTVADLRDGAAHDYLVVAAPDGREVLVPAVAELVEVTPDGVVVQSLPGLFDEDAEETGERP